MPVMGPTELIVILVLVMIVFGAGKLPSVGSALGKSVRDFRHSAMDDDALPSAAEERTDRPSIS